MRPRNILVGCSLVVITAAAVFALAHHRVASTAAAPAAPAWTRAADGIDAWDGTLPGTPARVVLYRFAAGAFVWRVTADDPAAASAPSKDVAAWAAALPGAAFVANGSYFAADGSPSGYLLANGVRVGARRFDADRSALLVLGARPSIRVLSAADLVAPPFTDALQSYPLLVDRGRAAVEADTGHASRRTFFGLDASGRAYVGLVPDQFVTLRELSVGLAALSVAWTSVLNLDGGPSSGVWIRTANGSSGFPSLSPVGNVIYAERLTPNQTPPACRRGGWSRDCGPGGS